MLEFTRPFVGNHIWIVGGDVDSSRRLRWVNGIILGVPAVDPTIILAVVLAYTRSSKGAVVG